MERQTEGERILFERWPSADALKREFPHMGNLLRGIFNTDSSGNPTFNVYEQGRVVSRELYQSSLKRNPTVGVILPGEYQFGTGSNFETMTVLDGQLDAAITFKSCPGPASRLRRDGTIVAPADTTLSLKVDADWAPCFYICRYTPRIEVGF